MQSYLFIGGGQDSLNVPVPPDLDTVQLPAGVTGKETYIRETLTVGDVFITIYRHESLTSEQVLNRLVESYKETYIRETLTVGDASIVIYRSESLTPEQVLGLLVKYYKAWAVNRPGGRL